jgi:hypothetical protein
MSIDHISFHDNYIPSLEAGKYKINIISDIEKMNFDQSDDKQSEENDKKDYFKNAIVKEFEVRSPQFSLSATEVHSVFPPTDSVARYGKMLPNIVLNKRTLPWERIIDQDNNTPWLALLALTEKEIEVDENGKAVLNIRTVKELLESDDIQKPTIKMPNGEDEQKSLCKTLTIKLETLKNLLPKLEEVNYLNHVREVDVSNQSHIENDEYGWFSVTVGNRFMKPQEDKDYEKFFLHLISLEGLTKTIENGDEDKNIEIISLYNWSCISQAENGKNFEELVTNFVTQANGEPEDPDKLLLRMYVKDTHSKVNENVMARFNNGYTAVNYNLHTGENTFSWYRGPFAPVVSQNLPTKEKFHYPSADAAMIYDEKHGVFDTSYAAAWTLGQLLGLSNGAFSNALFRYRKNVHNAIGYLVDRLKEKGNSLSKLKQGDKLQSYDSFKECAKILNHNLSNSIENATKADAASLPSKKASRKNTSERSSLDLLKELYKDSNLFSYLDSNEFASDKDLIIHWFARKQLLYDVPLNHFIPDEKYLPSESLRFFYIDPNWIDMMLDGALSIGIQTSKDGELTTLLKANFSPEILKEAGKIRDELFKKECTKPRQKPVCGVIINSAVVSGWPGLAIDGIIGNDKVQILRMDHIDNNMLLCLFEEIPKTITITEPQQSLCFGILDGFKIQHRKISGGDIGQPIRDKYFLLKEGDVDYIRENNTLNIIDLIPELSVQLGKGEDLLTPSEFAIQMVKAPQRLTFDFQEKLS